MTTKIGTHRGWLAGRSGDGGAHGEAGPAAARWDSNMAARCGGGGFAGCPAAPFSLQGKQGFGFPPVERGTEVMTQPQTDSHATKTGDKLENRRGMRGPDQCLLREVREKNRGLFFFP